MAMFATPRVIQAKFSDHQLCHSQPSCPGREAVLVGLVHIGESYCSSNAVNTNAYREREAEMTLLPH